MICGIMETIAKPETLEQVYFFWKDNIMRKTDTALDRPTRDVVSSFTKRIKHLYRMEDMRHIRAGPNILVPEWPVFMGSDQGHKPLLRLEIDLKILHGIKLSVDAYKKSIESAMSGMRLSADAQSWDRDAFVQMMEEIKEDSSMHTDELRERLIYSKNLILPKTESSEAAYKMVIGSAAMLSGEIRGLTEHMQEHLENVARAIIMKGGLREADIGTLLIK
jgi:hypothetical protein